MEATTVIRGTRLQFTVVAPTPPTATDTRSGSGRTRWSIRHAAPQPATTTTAPRNRGQASSRQALYHPHEYPVSSAGYSWRTLSGLVRAPKAHPVNRWTLINGP